MYTLYSNCNHIHIHIQQYMGIATFTHSRNNLYYVHPNKLPSTAPAVQYVFFPQIHEFDIFFPPREWCRCKYSDCGDAQRKRCEGDLRFLTVQRLHKNLTNYLLQTTRTGSQVPLQLLHINICLESLILHNKRVQCLCYIFSIQYPVS